MVKSENLPRSDNTNINMAGDSKNQLVSTRVAREVQIAARVLNIDIKSQNIPTEKMIELNQLTLFHLTGFDQVPPDFDDALLAQLMADYESMDGFPRLKALTCLVDRCHEILK